MSTAYGGALERTSPEVANAACSAAVLPVRTATAMLSVSLVGMSVALDLYAGGE